ncbi:efflux RND transporter periplasmic adaptor subunit [Carboxylicivirga taeanensis]|uniref:efflux RND transporter periplasmic adaptor subunit n=1 Tax=Carboxylicivirga taeanensis TaxID=1416875 RepID=UPI003F6E2897
MKKTITGILAAIGLLTLLIWQPWKIGQQTGNTVTVKKGKIESTVSAAGELKAEKAMDILIPEVCFDEELDIWSIKILSIADEGKIVTKGEQVAQLDPTEVEEAMAIARDKLSELYTQLEDARIDSSLALAAQRETIQKQRDLVMDTEIKVEQSSYESPAIQRQTQIELEKAQRSLSKTQRDLITIAQKHKTQIARSHRKIKRYEYKLSLLEQLRSQLIIASPGDGMIVYGNGYDGQKIKVGATVGRYMPLIATLPDLSSLISEIYVKEIDIAKIEVGQTVNIAVSALSDKVFQGQIKSIANIGQVIPGTFQNGFKVIVELHNHEAALLPNMTTNNTIITNSRANTLLVDKRAVKGNDSINYVFKRTGWSTIKQEVEVGIENEEFIEILQGLNEHEQVYLNAPKGAESAEVFSL